MNNYNFKTFFKVIAILQLSLVTSFLYSQNSSVAASNNQKAAHYILSGTIKSLDFQGKNYLSIVISTSDSKTSTIWCTGLKTKVYKGSVSQFWTDLKVGQKIGVLGKWEDIEGKKQVTADKIDIL